MKTENLFDLAGKTVVITGGGGVLCSTIAKGLAEQGALVAVLDIKKEAAESVAREIKQTGGKSIALESNVLNKENLQQVCSRIIGKFGRIDILINGAGGNNPKATTSEALKFFDLPEEAVKWVFDLNFMGTFLACQVFGKVMAQQGEGVILNISSMNAFRPLTKIPAYSAAKAAVSNFTQWLAVQMAQNYAKKIRVNALAPGFFVTQQNRFLLYDKNDKLTDRGKTIIAHTPLEKFGQPEDLVGTVLWLVSPASEFVTGIVVPIDGGFSAFSGV